MFAKVIATHDLRLDWQINKIKKEPEATATFYNHTYKQVKRPSEAKAAAGASQDGQPERSKEERGVGKTRSQC